MKSKTKILNFIIVVLCLIFVIFSGMFVGEIMDYNRSYHSEESSFLYSCKEQDYVRMVDMMHRNLAADVESSKTLEECYAIARYYEAATYFKAYQQAGNEELTKEKEKIMEEQLLLMGDLSYVADEIDKKLGLEK